MDNFKLKLKNRIKWAIVYCVVVILITVAMIVFGDKNYPMGFVSGASTGILLIVIVYVVKYAKALKNPEQLKKLYIEETDERTKQIGLEVGKTSALITLLALCLGMLVSVFFNRTVFNTILVIVLFVSILNAILNAYYSKKM